MTDQKSFWEFLEEALPEIRDFRKDFLKKSLPQGNPEMSLHRFFSALTGSIPAGKLLASPDFFEKGAGRIKQEWEELALSDPGLFRKAGELAGEITDPAGKDAEEALLNFLFPERTFAGGESENQIEEIRKRRTVQVSRMNPDPVRDPAKELLFSSNVLLTLPPEHYYPRLDPSLRKMVEVVAGEEQKYWFDHPILMGVDSEANEMIYGLRGLAQTLEYEKKKGTVPTDAVMTVILSLSVTHEGLKDLAHEYLAEELKKVDDLHGLRVYLFSEEDTRFLATKLTSLSDLPGAGEKVAAVFGVDGRYGRHYSFLKAVAPMWTLCVDDKIKGTFKIDLDQVFPQKELKLETGKTAFQHLCTPLWGSEGVDHAGREVFLGMIAGALVNEKDISNSLYSPDIPMPVPGVVRTGEARIFDKLQVMAVSTRGEMMTRYGDSQYPDHPDGKSHCLSRVHVTGGTNGILCETLRRYRPFTPGFIGRAEDQAYLLSVLLGRPGGIQEGPLMRYVHEAGLIMRHDKEAFAEDAIEAAKLGTWVGDLLRLLYFSLYARFLPGGAEAVKKEIDPFTGCFVSPFPFTLVFFRLVLKVLSEPENMTALLDLAERRLEPFVEGSENEDTIKAAWMKEKEGWDLYYDCLDLVESGITQEDKQVKDISGMIRDRIDNCRIR